MTTRPFSCQVLFTTGKIREIAERCQAGHVDAVVIVNALTAYQRRKLEERFGCPVLTLAELEHPKT